MWLHLSGGGRERRETGEREGFAAAAAETSLDTADANTCPAWRHTVSKCPAPQTHNQTHTTARVMAQTCKTHTTRFGHEREAAVSTPYPASSSPTTALFSGWTPPSVASLGSVSVHLCVFKCLRVGGQGRGQAASAPAAH